MSRIGVDGTRGKRPLGWRCVGGCLLGAVVFASCGGTDPSTPSAGSDGGHGGSAATGGTAGDGGRGGTFDGPPCTSPENTARILEYTFPQLSNPPLTGSRAVTEVTFACQFTKDEDETDGTLGFPNGCGTEWLDVGLPPSDPADTTDGQVALSTCLGSCLADQAIDVSPACLDCYVEQTVCETTFCLVECASDATCFCEECIIEYGCLAGFEACSGLPTSTRWSLVSQCDPDASD